MKLSKQNLSLSLSEFPRIVEGFPRTKVSNKQCLESCIKASERGRSMIEMLGVLAIIGVLSVGGIAGYSKAMAKYRINKTFDQITQIINNTRTLYANQSNYSGLSTTVAHDVGIVPDEMYAYSTWVGYSGYQIKFASHTLADFMGRLMGNYRDNYETAAVLLSRIPKEDCIALATMDWKTALGDSFVGINIGLTSQAHENGCTIGSNTSSGNNFCGNSVPVSPAVAAQKCGDFSGFNIKFH